MWAVQEGHAEVARFLLEKGAFVDFPDEVYTCIVKHHCPTPIAILLSVTQNGWTPVMQASQGGHVDVINILLDHNAKVNHQTEVRDHLILAVANYTQLLSDNLVCSDGGC